MGTSLFFASRLLVPFVLLISALHSMSIVSGYHQFSVTSENTTLLLQQFVPSSVKSPSSKSGSEFFQRVVIHGFPRLKHLKKFPNSLKIKVSHVNPIGQQPKVEVCFHRNMTLGVGMCHQGQWEKLIKGSWVKPMSPFDNKILDIRTDGPSAVLQVSVDEEIFLYRIVFLALGIIFLIIATPLSKSLVFYYGGAMTVGVLLVILIVLFQGMRLLPMGRRNPLAVVLYSSVVGVGTFLLRHVPSLLRSLLVEFGVEEDMYIPLVMFLLVFLVIAGAWLGFWAVRKLILTDDGDIDDGVARFVSWSIRIIATVMILQSSLDPLLAAEALLGGILFAAVLRKPYPLKFIHRIYRRLRKLRKLNESKFHDTHSSAIQELQKSKPFPRSSLNFRGSASKSPSELLDSEPFYSTFHETPERRKISKAEWDRFTKESTKRALQGLVSSPDFGKWAVAHADRLRLAPDKDVSKSNDRRRWFNLF